VRGIGLVPGIQRFFHQPLQEGPTIDPSMEMDNSSPDRAAFCIKPHVSSGNLTRYAVLDCPGLSRGIATERDMVYGINRVTGSKWPDLFTLTPDQLVK
jgi:hypothetical protein